MIAEYSSDLTSTNGGWQQAYVTYTIPNNTAYVLIECAAFIQNTNAATASFAQGTINDCSFDDLFCLVQVGMDYEVADGGTYLRMPSPPAASATANTTLTQSGTTTTINVAAGTFYLGNITLNFNSGSVNPGSYGKWYVYFDDPGYAGGAVTFYASSSALATSQAPYRFYVGTITTASGGGGGGGSGGGGGCCLHGEQLIELADGTEVRAADLVACHHVLTDVEGTTPVVKIGRQTWNEWFAVTLNNGVRLLVAGDHRFIDPAGEQLCARDLRLQQVVRGREGYLFVQKLEAVWGEAEKISIEVGEPHTYYVQGVLSHNKLLC